MPRPIPAIKQVMTPFPYALEPTASAGDAAALMRRHGIRHVPVRSGGVLVGLVSDRDLARLGRGEKSERRIDRLMSPEPFAVDLETPLDLVLERMAERQLDCTVVLKDDRIAGIFTTTDACRAFAEELRGGRRPGDPTVA